MAAWLTVIGIGDDGFDGVSRAARRAVFAAARIIGSPRHLAMLPPSLAARATPWPKPFSVDAVLAERDAGNGADAGLASRAVCVIASGDPMWFGVGATLLRRVPPNEVVVYPAASSFSFAAARLGWPLQNIRTLSLVGRAAATLNRYVYPGVRLFVLSADGNTPATVCAQLTARGFGASEVTVLEHLGGPEERQFRTTAHQGFPMPVAALNLVAIDCREAVSSPSSAAPGTGAVQHPERVTAAGMPNTKVEMPLQRPRWSNTPGMPDEMFRHDGQLTKRDVRAIVLARLSPLPGEYLWDVGAGCGSIGIEWMRSDPGCRAVAIEANATRRELIDENRIYLGVPSLAIVAGHAPEALSGLPTPDAVFIGGGVTVPGVLAQSWAALRPGGRLAVTAVTLQSERVVLEWQHRLGGTLTRIDVSHAAPLGGFDVWRQALPITLWMVDKPGAGAAIHPVSASSASSAAWETP